MEKAATLSPCGRYRYTLDRTWGPDLDLVTFVGFNPSVADAEVDDPTLRRCVGFARRFGFDRLRMVNLFAYRETDPARLPVGSEVIGPEQLGYLRRAVSASALVVACWGASPHRLKGAAVASFADQVREVGRGPAWCLGRSKDGSPRHPLYLRQDTPLEVFPW